MVIFHFEVDGVDRFKTDHYYCIKNDLGVAVTFQKSQNFYICIKIANESITKMNLKRQVARLLRIHVLEAVQGDYSQTREKVNSLKILMRNVIRH